MDCMELWQKLTDISAMLVWVDLETNDKNAVLFKYI